MAYSDGEKAEALIKLWHSKYAYESVSNDLDIPVRTLRRWDKAVPKKTIPDLLDRAIQRMLMAIPKNMSGQEWAIAMGILFDKWLLIQGEPTSREETIERKLGELNDDEYSRVLAEAESIIRKASSSDQDITSGNGQDTN